MKALQDLELVLKDVCLIRDEIFITKICTLFFKSVGFWFHRINGTIYKNICSQNLDSSPQATEQVLERFIEDHLPRFKPLIKVPTKTAVVSYTFKDLY